MNYSRTAQELIEFAKASMIQSGYSEEYISVLSSTWNALKKYLSLKSILIFTPKLGIAFLQDQYGIPPDCMYRKLSTVDKRRKRAIQILNNCSEHESIIKPKSYSLSKFALQFMKEFQGFIDVRINSGLSFSIINRDINCLNKFSKYLDGLNIRKLEETESTNIIGFIKSLSISKKPPTLNDAVSSLRLFLKFSFDEQYISRDLSHFVPQVYCKPEGIPSVYTKDEIQHLLNSVDRTGAIGKRNYAILLLAAKLGMRASDICGLTFDNLNWQTDTIEFIVKKTGVSAVLPLLNEVGEAIIDYIRFGRPVSEDKHVFLRMQIPFVALKPSVLHGIVSLALRNANITVQTGKRHGPHALRASLACAMLDNNIPLPVISEALSHKNSDTTRIYLKIDVQHLRQYSLDVPALGNIWMGGCSKMTMNFKGPFSELIQEFIEFKRSMGFKYIKEEQYLQHFSEFSLQFSLKEPILTKEISDAWCIKRPHENQRNNTEQRISCLRQFALYLVSIGYNAYIPVYVTNKKSRKSKYVAYVYTLDEIDKIIKFSDQIYPNRRSTMHLVMPVLVRLLYSTGLRIMEALKLQMKHVDLINGILFIENAKYNKDRLIPLSTSMFNVLKQYCDVMHPRYFPNDYLFVGITGQPYSHHNIYLRFREPLQQAGIPHAGRGNGPRIHDVRHTFTCHTLQAAVKRNVDLYAALPILSTYLGHESIQVTSQYLRMTAEVYPDIMDAVNTMCSYVIPEVEA